MIGNLSAESLPEPLNTFQAPHLERDEECERFVDQLARALEFPVPRQRRQLAQRLRSTPETGLPSQTLPRLLKRFDEKGLTLNLKARHVQEASPAPLRLGLDDLLLLYAAPNWTGHDIEDVVCEIDGRQAIHPELQQIANDHRSKRVDGANNGRKLALAGFSPYLSDRSKLRLTLQEIKYFDFDGPRRQIWANDVPSSVGKKYYLGKRIPDELPAALVCAHTVLLTRGRAEVVLGLRRVDVNSDYPYGDHLSVGFEEQMTPEDQDVFRTVRRGLAEEAGLSNSEGVSGILCVRRF